jgi:outer membrane immunogenic protein
LTAGAAVAGDLPTKASGSGTYNWSGCYLGIHGGGAWGQVDWVPALGNDFGDYRANGWIAGGQLGCDVQSGAFVFGVEGQFSGAKLDGANLVESGPATLNVESRIDKLATGTGRIGYAADRVLPYVKGGFAWVHDESHDISPTTGGGSIAANSAGVFGWTAGGGIEVAFRPNWSWKIEYNHIDLGTNAFTFTQPGLSGTFPLQIKQTVDDVLIGVNYRFQ